MTAESLRQALADVPRVRLGHLPTPLEPGPRLPGGAKVLIKRDDLTALGMGGNKVRKLEFLCGDALSRGADTLVTLGAAQSNHARLTAAAGAVLGIPTHLVLGGNAPDQLTGNQLLSALFGATLHFPGTDDWDRLEEHTADLSDQLTSEGRNVYRMPIGGSTGVGVLGFVAGWLELLDQCADLSIEPSTIIHASSTGGTHAGLLVGRAACRERDAPLPDVLAIGVAKRPDDLAAASATLAAEALHRLGLGVEVHPEEILVDGRWQGEGYAVPTAEADAAVQWAASRAALVLDRVYTGKAFAGLLGASDEGRWVGDDTVVFWHTGGQPAVFAPSGTPQPIRVPSDDQRISGVTVRPAVRMR